MPWETRSKTDDFRSKFASILEASESTRMRVEESLPKDHEDHIAGKGHISLQHYNLVHNLFLCLKQRRHSYQKQQLMKNGTRRLHSLRGIEQRHSWNHAKAWPSQVN